MRGIRRALNLDTVRYGVRCLRWRSDPTLMRCPSCRSRSGTCIDRKAWITSLIQCETCGLLYRRPQEPYGFADRFYQEEYQSALTTTLPEPEPLASMLASAFRGTEKDLGDKIETFRALGLSAGARILDYGSSWGYGVWQLKVAGYQAEGFEVSRRRAGFGRRNLAVTIHTDTSQLARHSYDAVFTNHVLEHVPDPNMALTQIGLALRPGGWLVAFFPNGSDECRRANPERFHCNWGRLHPVYLTDEYCLDRLRAKPNWMISKPYDSRPDLAQLTQWDQAHSWKGDMRENEMMLVARF